MADGGSLRVFLGAAPGVGKTYAMLAEGCRLLAAGTDVVVGLVETHGRQGTEGQLGGLPVLPRRRLAYRGTVLTELDLDAVLARRPGLVLVDELAHTNAPGSRNAKRWQDVLELRKAGIPVATTLNIQHLESLSDVVEQITGIVQHEHIPDAVVRAADRIELVDLSPEALRSRMAQGEIYTPDKIDLALDNYFRAGNLGALRELALLWLADEVEDELADYRARHHIHAPWETKERIMVALDGSPHGEHLIRRGARTAARVHGELIGVHVRADDGTRRTEPPALADQRRLLRELHGGYAEISGADVARALVEFAHTESATQILLGPTSRSRLRELLSGSVINRVIRLAGPIDVRILPPPAPGMLGLPPEPRRRRPADVGPRRRLLGWLLGPAGALALAAALSPARGSLGLSGALLCLLLLVAGIARLGGLAPAAATTAVSVLAADWYLTTPRHSLTVDRTADAVALLLFLAVAGIIAHLIDGLARRSQQAARARAEAQTLARLAGQTVHTGAPALRALLAELRRSFGLVSAGILTRARDGWRPLVASGTPLPERPEAATFAAELDDGTVLVLHGPTLSEENTRLLGPFVTQLRLARERERLTREAAAARALARTDALHTTLLEAVAHDLRRSLAAIRSAADGLGGNRTSGEARQEEAGHGAAGAGGEAGGGGDATSGGAGGGVAELAAGIGVEVERLEHLRANLLGLSRLRAGTVPVRLRATPVGELVAAALAGLPGAGAAVVTAIPADLPPVEADSGLMERALANVVANALAASPPGRPVRIDAGVVGGRVHLRVVDRGQGLPDAPRERLFDPFDHAGGLGLAVAKGFTEAMGGTLTPEDTPAGGATFVFALRPHTRH